jgi:hypothetical protein
VCIEKHVFCSNHQKGITTRTRATSAPAAKPEKKDKKDKKGKAVESEDDVELIDPAPPTKVSKSSSLLGSITKGLRRRSGTKPSEETMPLSRRAPSDAPIPSYPTPRPVSKRSPQKMEVSVPRVNTAIESSVSPQVPSSLLPSNPYSPAGPSSSSLSLSKYASSSFSSLTPGSEEYRFEFERLQIQYRRSQEQLRLQEETARAQQEEAEAYRQLHERERAAWETRQTAQQEELAVLRQQLADSQGKRRK